MNIVNQTIFSVVYIPGRFSFPKYSLTLIVKDTLDLKPGQPAVISEEQIFPTGDEFYPEDKDMIGGPRYASDFAYFKPKADLLLVGKCYTPEAKKAYSTNVKFHVGSNAKALTIFGNRYWVGSFNTVTKPEPFSEMELRYDNSYGGEEYRKNPVGKGIDKVEIKTGDKLIPLPNILHPGENISSQSTKFEPAGFGPYGQMWIQRFSKLGTYKGNYLKERWPWFPKDFDWGYYNAAPADMQVPGYLKGNEKLYFENLHPVHSQYHSQLPGIRVRCFINEFDENKTNSIDTKFFKEVKMNLDTLWVDMENEKLVLVWRGISEIKTEDYEEIKNIFIVSEKLEEQPHSVEYYSEQLKKELAEPEEEILEPEPVEQIDEEDIEIEAEIAKSEEQMRESLIESGIDPDNPPEPTEEDKKKEAELLKEMGFEEGVEEDPLTQELFIKRVNNKESFEGEDLRELNLSELDLQGLNFQNAILTGVTLKDSNLSNSNFTEANLADADLSGAKLNNIVLVDADLTGAILLKVDLTSSILEGSIFEKANLQDAIINSVRGKNSVFSEAFLSGASLVKSDFSKADFSNAVLDNTDFKESVLSEASFENASVKQSDFSKTDLTKMRAANSNFTKSVFKESFGPEINWNKADLSEADFSYSEMEGANFTSTMMQKANLYAANMKFSRFTKANLTNAVLKEMNMFQGSFEKADLTNADCSGSNFYAAEFLDAIIKDTKFQFTNLKMSKLSK